MTIDYRKLRRAVMAFAAICAGLAPPAAAADPKHDLLLFGSVDTVNTFRESDPAVDERLTRPVLDVLYSYSGDRFRVLGEYLWSSEESELERLKAGWQLSDETIVWFGRFHSSASYWASEFHHGQFLQPTITRPALESWEDESGPLAMHITGFAVDYDHERADQSTINIGFTAGIAPRFVDDELRAFDMLDPESGHGASLNFRLGYSPDVLAEKQFGLLVGWNDIDVDSASNPALADLDDIAQLTVGIFADWRWRDWRFLANLTHFDMDLRQVDTSVRDRFLVSYLQAEYQVNENWSLFARTDNGFGEDNSPFLRYLPAFIAHRHMVGARWNIGNYNALTLEVADVAAQGSREGIDHDYFKEVRFQWSAVLPW